MSTPAPGAVILNELPPKDGRNRMTQETKIIDQAIYDTAVATLRKAGVRLPTLKQLADPSLIPDDILNELQGIDPDAAHPANLFRVHWYNHQDRKTRQTVPGYIDIPSALSGTPARIIAITGERFPMISAHKVLAAYACLAPRIVSGAFDPVAHRAVWPSTGNYCRGGLAISRILGCRGVAVLPEGMSKERFDWLEQWATDPQDIIRTPGTESNVKEIYDKCAELEADDKNVIINQFSEFGNYLAHYHCTGAAAGKVYSNLAANNPNTRMAAFVSATGSAGTIGAGDYLKENFGAEIVAVEATECPTLLRNGYGSHNIQGIGDKHIPYIHNVMNTDCVIGISERSSDQTYLLMNTDVGREYLAKRHGISQETLESFSSLGLSGIANILAAIKYARHFELGADDVVITVATDNASLYTSQVDDMISTDYCGTFDEVSAGEIFGEHLNALGSSELQDLTYEDRLRIFNLGYFTWVEQQGVSLDEFDKRKDQKFWRNIVRQLPELDEQIEEFNRQVASS